MPEYEPTPEQARILAHDISRSGRLLAGPGTGKSATLVALVDELMRRDEPPRLKLLTFTRAATGQQSEKDRTRDARPLQAAVSGDIPPRSSGNDGMIPDGNSSADR